MTLPESPMNRIEKNSPMSTITKTVRHTSPFGLVADDLLEVERILDDALASYTGPLGPISQHLRHYRGKRLRPALLLLSAKACGNITPHHHTLAAVVEMIHTATLVHDDVLDSADTRRHVRTVNDVWDNQTAVLLGDMLFSHAFHMTSSVDVRACRLIGESTNRVCAGELRQVTERGNLHLSEESYYSIIDGKTAALTEVCTRLGAAYANTNDEVEERFARYGKHLGYAFQIADDLLDYVGAESKVGKTLGTDAIQQKLTLPLIHCLSKLPAAEADKLRDELKLNKSDLRYKLLQAMEKTGSLAYASFRAEDHASSARSELANMPNSDYLDILTQLPLWAIKRDQ